MGAVDVSFLVLLILTMTHRFSSLDLTFLLPRLIQETPARSLPPSSAVTTQQLGRAFQYRSLTSAAPGFSLPLRKVNTSQCSVEVLTIELQTHSLIGSPV